MSFCSYFIFFIISAATNIFLILSNLFSFYLFTFNLNPSFTALSSTIAQIVTNVQLSPTENPCVVAGNRTITVRYTISSGPVLSNVRITITNLYGSAIYGATILTDTRLANGANKTVDIILDVPVSGNPGNGFASGVLAQPNSALCLYSKTLEMSVIINI